MEKITSMHNPRVQAWRSLKTKSGREAEGAFLVEGFKSVGEALSSSFELLALIVEDGTSLPDGAPEGRAFVVPAHLMAAVCDTKTPQGIAAVMQSRWTAYRIPAMSARFCAQRMLPDWTAFSTPPSVRTPIPRKCCAPRWDRSSTCRLRKSRIWPRA